MVLRRTARFGLAALALSRIPAWRPSFDCPLTAPPKATTQDLAHRGWLGPELGGEELTPSAPARIRP
jgi:hypothetical protein